MTTENQQSTTTETMTSSRANRPLHVSATVKGVTVTLRIPCKSRTLQSFCAAFGEQAVTALCYGAIRRVYNLKARSMLMDGKSPEYIRDYLESGAWKPAAHSANSVSSADRVVRDFSSLPKEEQEAVKERILRSEGGV